MRVSEFVTIVVFLGKGWQKHSGDLSGQIKRFFIKLSNFDANL